jgi:hypothetical protein
VQVVAHLVQRKSEPGGEVLGGGSRLEEGLGPLPKAVKGLLQPDLQGGDLEAGPGVGEEAVVGRDLVVNGGHAEEDPLYGPVEEGASLWGLHGCELIPFTPIRKRT